MCCSGYVAQVSFVLRNELGQVYLRCRGVAVRELAGWGRPRLVEHLDIVEGEPEHGLDLFLLQAQVFWRGGV